jgi:hypothetical protein
MLQLLEIITTGKTAPWVTATAFDMGSRSSRRRQD